MKNPPCYQNLVVNVKMSSYRQVLNTCFTTLCFPLSPWQLKEFVKKCKVAALCKQVKQVLDKAEETAKVVEARRRSTTFNLADIKAVVSRGVTPTYLLTRRNACRQSRTTTHTHACMHALLFFILPLS